MQNSEKDNSLVLSFKRLRQLVGWLGIAMPIVMVFYALVLSPCGSIEHSISAYYHTHIRNVFVAILCAVGVFMISYKGYDLRDTIASRLAGMFAICVAMFPTDGPSHCEQNGLLNSTIGRVHYTSAIGLFVTFAIMSIFLFTKTDPTKEMTRKKEHRNSVYYLCGWIIVASILLIILHTFTGILPESIRPVFSLEAIALFAFGTSWLTKGEGIKPLND